MNKIINRIKLWHILSFALIYKIIAWKTTGVYIFNDSAEYLLYSENILKGDWISPSGARTPGYPSLIVFSYIIFGKSVDSIIFLQIITGTLTLLIIYNTYKLLNKEIIGKLLITLLLFSQISLFDVAVLTESFAITLTALLVNMIIRLIKNNGFFLVFYLVITLIILVLVRPQFAVVAIMVGIIIFLYKHKKVGIIIILASIFVTLSWSSINLKYNSFLGMTTLLGFNLINHTGGFIEKGQEVDTEIVSIYLKYRNEKDSLGISNNFTIWNAKDEMIKNLKIDDITLSKRLIRLSLSLILKDPIAYLKSVHKASLYAITYNSDYIKWELKYIVTPTIFMIIFYICGVVFMFLTINIDNKEDTILTGMFLVNFLLIIVLDVGENFRYTAPLFFIPLGFFIEYLIKFIKYRNILIER